MSRPKSKRIVPRRRGALDRAREKLDRFGPSFLEDDELLAIILGGAGQQQDAFAVANGLLTALDGLKGLVRASPDDLRCMEGVGITKAIQVIAAIELGRRTFARLEVRRPRLDTPHEMARYLLPRFGGPRVEQFGIVALDSRHRLLRATAVCRGILTDCLVHPRETFREAILRDAAAIVLFHNHPSGDPFPSLEDEKVTRRFLQAGDVIGIDVLDHIILADTTYFSFREAKRI